MTVMTRRIERDFGYWSLPMTRGGWRLSWEQATGWLRLYHLGGDELVLRLARYESRHAVDALLDGWVEAPHADDGNLDGRWLAVRCPAVPLGHRILGGGK